MTDCDSYEVDIEMQKHGALAPERSTRLDAHLAGCPSCRRYQAQVRQTEQTMGATSLVMDFDALGKRISRFHRGEKRRIWFAAAAFAGLWLAASLVTSEWLIFTLVMGSAALLILGGLRLRGAYQERATARLGKSQAEFLERYRLLLERRIKRIKRLSVFVPCFILVLGAQSALMYPHWPAPLRTPAYLAVLITGWTLAIAVVVGLRVREVPALQRELRDLEGR